MQGLKLLRGIVDLVEELSLGKQEFRLGIDNEPYIHSCDDASVGFQMDKKYNNEDGGISISFSVHLRTMDTITDADRFQQVADEISQAATIYEQVTSYPLILTADEFQEWLDEIADQEPEIAPTMGV